MSRSSRHLKGLTLRPQESADRALFRRWKGHTGGSTRYARIPIISMSVISFGRNARQIAYNTVPPLSGRGDADSCPILSPRGCRASSWPQAFSSLHNQSLTQAFPERSRAPPTCELTVVCKASRSALTPGAVGERPVKDRLQLLTMSERFAQALAGRGKQAVSARLFRYAMHVARWPRVVRPAAAARSGLFPVRPARGWRCGNARSPHARTTRARIDVDPTQHRQ